MIDLVRFSSLFCVRRFHQNLMRVLLSVASISLLLIVNGCEVSTTARIQQGPTFSLDGFVVEAGVVTTFDVPGASLTTPAAINSSGVIAGSCVVDKVSEGFTRDLEGNFTTFGLPDYPVVSVSAINASGEITGTVSDKVGMSHGFVRDALGNVTVFDAPGVGIWGTQSLAINASGQITGYWYDPNALIHGFLRDASGDFTSFDAPHAGATTAFSGTFPRSINDSGVITGSALTDANIELAFVKSGSDSPVSFEDPLASIIANHGTVAWKVNSHGRIVGQYSNPGGFAGFYRDVLPPSNQRELNSN
jgi:hypothetical protein